MKMKKLKIKSVSSSPCSSSTSSITTHSLASSTDSSPSSSSSTCYQLSPNPITATKCRGLDLLVKAIHQVTAGSIVGVPYIQKRVITRRRSRKTCTNLNMLFLADFGKKDERLGENEAKNVLLKRQRRMMALPSKYQDSVLQSWKPKKTRYGVGEICQD